MSEVPHRQKVVTHATGIMLCACSCGFRSTVYLDRDACDRAWGAHLRNVIGDELADLDVEDKTGVWSPTLGASREQAIFEALGAASSCWDNLVGAGTFESTRCRDIGYTLMEYLGEPRG